MHVLFVHKNFPAQFGHIAHHLVEQHGYRCTFVCEHPDAKIGGIERIQYRTRGGARRESHYCSRSFENFVWHSHAVYETLKRRPDIQPDLVVGHSGFGSTAFLADLYDCPIINYFEYYYRAYGADLDFRPDFPSTELNVLRAAARNAMLLLDLQTCAAGYAPTEFQRGAFPQEYQGKLQTIFDGVDRSIWRKLSAEEIGPRTIAGREIPPEVRIVTYVSRGFESTRGFDIFMRAAKRICDARRDVVFVCVGEDRVCYGGDELYLGGRTFRQWVLEQDTYDLDRFIFTGRLPPVELARVLNLSDLHFYLTIPFVLSWSLFNAMACGCAVLASDTAPVQEVIEHGRNGLLAGFFDVDRFTELALDVLDDRERRRELGQNAARLIEEKYALERTLPKMLEMYARVRETYLPGEKRWAARRPRAAELAATVATPLSGAASTRIVPNSYRSAAFAALNRTASEKNGATNRRRVLVTVPHFYRLRRGSIHGSGNQTRRARVAGLTRCLASIQELFGGEQYTTDLTRPNCHAANELTLYDATVVVCTDGVNHLLDEVRLPPGYFFHAPRSAKPQFLGFGCHSILRDSLGKFDYYCYMEDDLVLHDAWLFRKLGAFVELAGADYLLQPNRYEGAHSNMPRKAYIDGELPPEATARFQNAMIDPEFALDFMGTTIRCVRGSNPHAGCFFLNAAQMEYWAKQPYFLDGDASFYSPLESAATLGIMRAFRVYKPAPEAANFLEVQHFGASLMKRITARDAAMSTTR
ncbi:MAG TPA: glycosyltransferase [Pirellulales bacterium]|nr:glycosyltransferase [Pirellulales bacterium]